MGERTFMPWGTDYINLCNMTKPDLKSWLQSREWFRPKQADVGKRRFSDPEVEEIYGSLQTFRSIAIKWVKDKPLIEDEKWIVIMKYLRHRNGDVKGAGKDVKKHAPVNYHFDWPGNRLESLELTELVTEVVVDYIEFNLYRALCEDVQAVKRGERRKPRIGALKAETEKQRTCGRFFRLKPGKGQPRVFCSDRCESTAHSRVRGKNRKKMKGKYIPEGI